jgi:hypothetical protein
LFYEAEGRDVRNQNGGVPNADAAFSIGTAKPMPTKKR